MSPFIALTSVVSLRHVPVLVLLALPVGVMVTLYRRWFCHYACPVGLLLETLDRFPRPASLLRRRGRHERPDVGSGLKPCPATADEVARDPRAATTGHAEGLRRRLRWPALGPWLALLTCGGAVVGYPLFLWLDPLAIFNGFLNSWREPVTLVTLLTGLGLPVLLLLDLAAPRLWCNRICPLGATQDFLAWPQRRLQRPRRCADPNSVPPPIQAYPGRRWFLAVCAGAAAAMALRTVRADSGPLLRPPGSLDDWQFTGVCLRCGNCAQVCPSRIIQPDFGDGGLPGLLAPRLRFDRDYCREDCHRCNEVCPSGAIARLSLADKRRRVLGRARVDLTVCLLAQGRECTACIQKCPYHAIAMKSTDGGFSNEPQVLLDRCIGCGACEAVCPTRPERAIRVHAGVG
ncbi:MAG: 4Fe-4S dicluster domain-containing protein [Verrucomicrobia bacterium]|nr:4Fe-4S dicluster domain-containing protein [Verrucomicrobiota bacterium]